jgi:RNA polymerase sigma-70 factor (ECF subfamily)
MDGSFRALVRAGDSNAFGKLFDEHARAIHRYALRATGERATAEDVVSLTFLEAWRLRERVLADGGSLAPWLFGIATNVLRNTRRAARRHRAALERLPAPEPVPDFTDELMDRVGEREELAAARAALRALRPAEREVVTVCVWSGLSYAEAAEALGVPIGTIRSRLSRAKARLRTLADRELRAMYGRLEPQPITGQLEVVRTDAVRSKEARE